MSEQKNVSETAETAALLRAIACYETDGNIRGNDDIAKYFLSEEKRNKITNEIYRNAVKAIARNGLYEYIIARTAYFDDLFVHALGENIPQIVLLGAGYDSRIYRYNGSIGNTKVFEVDAPFTQENKLSILKSNEINTDKAIYVSVDFEKDNLMECMINSGYCPLRKTLHIWEGVCFYLTPGAVEETLTALISNSAPQSVISFDYVNIHISGDIGIRRKDESVLFGMDKLEMEDYLETLNCRILQNMDFNEMNRLYLTCETGEIFGKVKTTLNIIKVETEAG